MGDVSSLRQDSGSQPGPQAAEGQRRGNTRPEGIWGKLSEHVLATAITVILFGTVTALVTYWVSYFVNKINAIETTIAKHHGPEWHTLEKVVEIGELRREFLEAKAEYDIKLTALEQLMGQQIDELQEQSEAIAMWTKQGDAIMHDVQRREYDAYAHLANWLPDDENVATVNIAHVKGRSFQVGDYVVVRNEHSGRKEQIEVRVAQQYSDLDNTDVLLQLGSGPARALNFSLELGKLKINARKKFSDDKRWRSYRELLAGLN